MKKDSEITRVGRNPAAYAGMMNPPIYQTSTVLFPTLESYHQAGRGTPFYEITQDCPGVDLSYGLASCPTALELQRALAVLEGGERCVLTQSGLSAITTTLLSFLKGGDHLLVVDSVYFPTRRFCDTTLKSFGIETTYYDPAMGEEVAALVRDSTRLLFLESPGSITFEVQDIPALVRVAKSRNLVTVLDNSWATPLYFQPFSHGVDVSIQAVTKYIGGHSDLFLGAVVASGSHWEAVARTARVLGAASSPYECSLALRGLRTLSARLEKQARTTAQIIQWLETQPLVSRILYPAHPACPGHEFWRRDFLGATSLFSVVLRRTLDRAELSKFADGMRIFGIGASWGGYQSLVLDANPALYRKVPEWIAEGSLLRFYVGLEDAADLLEDLTEAFGRIQQ